MSVRTPGSVVRWALYALAITVVAAPVALLLVDKVWTLEAAEVWLQPYVLQHLGAATAEQHTLKVFCGIVAAVCFAIVFFLTRNTKVGFRIYSHHQRIR